MVKPRPTQLKFFHSYPSKESLATSLVFVLLIFLYDFIGIKYTYIGINVNINMFSYIYIRIFVLFTKMGSYYNFHFPFNNKM